MKRFTQNLKNNPELVILIAAMTFIAIGCAWGITIAHQASADVKETVSHLEGVRKQRVQDQRKADRVICEANVIVTKRLIDTKQNAVVAFKLLENTQNHPTLDTEIERLRTGIELLQDELRKVDCEHAKRVKP